MNDLKNQIAFVTEGNDFALKDFGLKSIEQTLRKAQMAFNRWNELSEERKTLETLLEMLETDYFKLLDMLTIKEKKGGFKGLKVAIIGDIYHSRVVRSNIYGLTKLGADVSVGGPTTLMPPGMERLGVKVFNNVEDAIKDADVVMGLRIQLERQKKGLFPSIREYYRFFGVDNERLKLAKPGALVMHPGPVNRGVEFSSSVIDGEQSVINEQVTNGVAVRMAVMYILSRGGFED